jgi:hypothetical protein
MVEKSSPTELWSASLLSENLKGAHAGEARRICNEWAEASIFRFFLVVSFLIAFMISRYYLV